MRYNVKLGDGRIGWTGRLREMFASLDEFALNDRGLAICGRLGHATHKAAWDANTEVVRTDRKSVV